jgi:hypothetical protein
MPSHPRRPITPVSSVCRVLEPHRAIRNTNARIGCGVGGRPGWRWVQRRATRWRANAAGFWETPAVTGAAGWVAVCSGR